LRVGAVDANHAKSCLILRYPESMRTTKTLSITLPPQMLARAERLARKEHRTMSELVREALRHYERKNWWDEMNAYGRQTAAAAGVRGEEDVVRVIHQMRQEKRSRKRPIRSST
jgi:CopG family transcriptional regulator / antitoxin EndoAI